MELLAVSLFYFLTQHLYKTASRKKKNYLCLTLVPGRYCIEAYRTWKRLALFVLHTILELETDAQSTQESWVNFWLGHSS